MIPCGIVLARLIGPPAPGDRPFLAPKVKYNWLYRAAGKRMKLFVDVTATADIAVKDQRTSVLLLVWMHATLRSGGRRIRACIGVWCLFLSHLACSIERKMTRWLQVCGLLGVKRDPEKPQNVFIHPSSGRDSKPAYPECELSCHCARSFLLITRLFVICGGP